MGDSVANIFIQLRLGYCTKGDEQKFPKRGGLSFQQFSSVDIEENVHSSVCILLCGKLSDMDE